MTVVEKEGVIYHDEHGITVKISNDNTKHIKVCTVTVRSDGDWNECLKKALELYKDAAS